LIRVKGIDPKLSSLSGPGNHFQRKYEGLKTAGKEIASFHTGESVMIIDILGRRLLPFGFQVQTV
jgi:hypothetical protein